MKFALSRKNLWERLPVPAKEIAGSILGRLPMSTVLGADFRASMRFLSESQWWSHDEIHAYQEKELASLLRFVASSSPYYGRLFNDIGFESNDRFSIDQLQEIPFSDKSIIVENLDHLITVDRSSREIDYLTTGGTSGTTLRFFAPRSRSAIEYAYLVSGWQRTGFRLGDTMAVLRGKTVEPDRVGLRHYFDPLLRHHYYSSFHLNDAMMERYVQHIRSIGRCYLHVYPSSAASLVKYMRRNGQRPFENLEGVLAESENVYRDQRGLIEEFLGCRMFASYGHTEKLVAAAECEHTTDYHVWPTYGFFELIDKDGNRVTNYGEVGEIVGTGFINRVTPFIRYRTGDFAQYVSDRCRECDRNHPILRKISGHNIQEFLIARDGSAIPWSAVNMHDDTFDDVIQFQFYQDEPGKAVLKLRVSDSFSNDSLERLVRNIEKKFVGRITVTTKFVEHIPLTKSGKSVFVDQALSVADFTTL